MIPYSKEPRTREYVIGCGFFLTAQNLKLFGKK